ncbi:MAG: hypothetical protein ACWGOX_08155 [Desulforhopalus sp.]
MSKLSINNEELSVLQQEVEELDNCKKNLGLSDKKSLSRNCRENESRRLDDAAAEKCREYDGNFGDLTRHFESFVVEVEDLARERPVLAILGAFTLGIIVGQMFSRK